MKVYIIYTHPNPKSFNHAILESFTKGLADAGHSFEISDLYADNFKAVLDVKDLEQIDAGKIPEDIKFYQDKISVADALVFINPLWWLGFPALVKGWIDRVLSSGFAYYIGEAGKPVPLLTRYKALVINTVGGTPEQYQAEGLNDLAYRLVCDFVLHSCCGMQIVEHVIFHPGVKSDENTRKGYLEQAYSLGKQLSDKI